MENFIYCPKCKGNYGKNTPGCAICSIKEQNEIGHVGYFNLLNGWTCYLACPKCKGESENV